MKLHCEREIVYVEAQCPVTKRYSRNKAEFTDKWIVYKTVGDPAYQTPIFKGTQRQAKKFIANHAVM